jgi:EAL domain-containing protein (putative c-di-GMP-specific phosphodiesterase class I)
MDRLSSEAIARIVQPGDLRVVFQPIVDLWTIRPFAYEALVRCALPRFRDPTELFRNAAENDCSGRLGRMIREITFPLAPGVRLFVNVHPAELDARWLVRPDDPLFSHDEEVYLEITEAVPIPSASRYLDVLREMRLRGQVHVVVDDLGSGYSNLQWLVDLQPEVAKLDMRLTHGVDHDLRQRRLVAGIVRLCADLDLAVVAEGIETAAQACALRDLGVRYGQGFLFARPAFPLPVVDATVMPRGPDEPAAAPALSSPSPRTTCSSRSD